LQQVWNKTDYYASRCLDVYVIELKKILKSNNIGLTIKNITKIGFILE
jgi:DNA-binding response OmpR family regulator